MKYVKGDSKSFVLSSEYSKFYASVENSFITIKFSQIDSMYHEIILNSSKVTTIIWFDHEDYLTLEFKQLSPLNLKEWFPSSWNSLLVPVIRCTILSAFESQKLDLIYLYNRHQALKTLTYQSKTWNYFLKKLRWMSSVSTLHLWIFNPIFELRNWDISSFDFWICSQSPLNQIHLPLFTVYL